VRACNPARSGRERKSNERSKTGLPVARFNAIFLLRAPILPCTFIETLTIEGASGFCPARIRLRMPRPLRERHPVHLLIVVGPNNAGKSSLIEALVAGQSQLPSFHVGQPDFGRKRRVRDRAQSSRRFIDAYSHHRCGGKAVAATASRMALLSSDHQS